MHVHYAQLQLLCVLFQSIALNWARATTASSALATKKGLSSAKRTANQRSDDRNLGKKKLAGYDEANNKVPRVLIQEGYLCPCPAAMSTHSWSFPNWTVLGKEDRRSLEVAAAVPWFWRKDCESLPTFVSFVYVSMGGMSGKPSAELKTPRRRGQPLRR